jgi:hypothetical protein
LVRWTAHRVIAFGREHTQQRPSPTIACHSPFFDVSSLFWRHICFTTFFCLNCGFYPNPNWSMNGFSRVFVLSFLASLPSSHLACSNLGRPRLASEGFPRSPHSVIDSSVPAFNAEEDVLCSEMCRSPSRYRPRLCVKTIS